MGFNVGNSVRSPKQTRFSQKIEASRGGGGAVGEGNEGAREGLE